tara:strand:- start:1 stop:651 length:651 start_codon:yes stop_codon:yes gene_type:complete
MSTQTIEPTGKHLDQPICGAVKLKGKGKSEPEQDDICGLTAGWGTDHLGTGRCRLHPLTSVAEIDNRFSYEEVLQNPRLVEIYREQEAQADLDNLDKEIVLLRSLVVVVAENFGVELKKDEDSNEILLNIVENPSVLRGQASQVIGVVRELTSAIKRKYEVLQIAGETIPREKVIQYVTQVRMVLNQTLRDHCPNCHENIHMRENAAEALSLIGDL